MTIELLSGDAAATAADDASLSGTLNPRAFSIGEQSTRHAQRLIEDAFNNKWGADKTLAEAFATSDFKLAAAAELDKEMLAQYTSFPSVWREYTDVTKVRDFRPKRLQSRWRNTVGFARVPELTEYPGQDTRGAAEYAIAVAKYGRRFAISWEAWVNNEAVQELEDLPGELARQAGETEMIAALSNLLLVDPTTNMASDVNTAFFNSTNGNAPDTLPLTATNVDAVLQNLGQKVDPHSGRKIPRPEMRLVVPQSLAIAAERIKAVREVRRTTTTGTGQNAVTTETLEANVLANLDYTVEPMLDYLNQNAKAATTWFMVPKPGSQRPALWTAFLAGHEEPDLRVKADTGQRAGGGDISPLEGSFDIDDIQYRGRHIVGNQQGDALFTYCSRGAA